MKKQLMALVAALGLAGFASAGANVTGDVELHSNVIHWATVVFCEAYEDGRMVEQICVEGHTGFVVEKIVDATLGAVPWSPATTFVAR